MLLLVSATIVPLFGFQERLITRTIRFFAGKLIATTAMALALTAGAAGLTLPGSAMAGPGGADPPPPVSAAALSAACANLDAGLVNGYSVTESVDAGTVEHCLLTQKDDSGAITAAYVVTVLPSAWPWESPSFISHSGSQAPCVTIPSIFQTEAPALSPSCYAQVTAQSEGGAFAAIDQSQSQDDQQASAQGVSGQGQPQDDGAQNDGAPGEDAVEEFPNLNSSVELSLVGEPDATSVTVRLSGHSGAWWHTIEGGDCLEVEEGVGSTHDVTYEGLTSNTDYRFLAFNASGCVSNDDVIACLSFSTAPVPGDRARSFEIGGLADAGNGDPSDIWSDGTLLWVLDDEDDKVYAYRMSDQTRMPERDISLFSADWKSMSYHNGRMYLSRESSDPRLIMYRLDTGERHTGTAIVFDNYPTVTDFDMYAGQSWVLDAPAGKVYKYGSEGSWYSSSTISLASENSAPKSIWIRGSTLWVLDAGADKLFAYSLDEGNRIPEMDYELDSENGTPRGVWGDDDIVRVLNTDPGYVFAYIAH